MNKDHHLLEIHRRILELVGSGQATTRKELAQLLPASASSVSVRTGELIAAGYLVDGTSGPSSGGRRPTYLELASDTRTLIAASLGTHHAQVCFARGDESIITSKDLAIDTALGPSVLLKQLMSEIDALVDAHSHMNPPSILCVGLPAPIDKERGCVDSGARLPGWHLFPIVQVLEDHFHIPVLLENDADLLAVGEHSAHPGIRHSITVKAGSALGVGIVISSTLYRGATGAAGDISHVCTPAFGDLPCTCGKNGCLETVVAGHKLAEQWSAITGTEQSVEDLLAAAGDGNTEAGGIVRQAGQRIGVILSGVVSFFNPDAIFIGGLLSTSEIFLAAIRASLYANCHPLITRHLTIEGGALGKDGGIRGAIHLAANQLKP